MENSTIALKKEIIYVRYFDALPELVWKCWTQAEFLAKWFGPNGFSVTTSEFNLIVGGFWKFTMHGPDGTDYPNIVQYLEIDKPNKLVYRQLDNLEKPNIEFKTTIIFEAIDGKTKLTMHQNFESAELLKQLVEKFGALEGGKQTLARLEILANELTREKNHLN